ncbi:MULTISPECIES: hypothetical protein [unclassified Thalassolituus]|uniref:hypothetical protein n=1 Tax=unclassified Thalassolituus TaxID=2624967 RepID=UPI000C11A343|nr:MULTISPECIES: hypothetical protein [unclassified Thalassolituus]MBN56516.1 hypothetical protein [Oceanospirillaceae bacterium]
MSESFLNVLCVRTGQQGKDMSHNQWLVELANAVFSKLERGQSEFVSNEDARQDMEARKSRIRNKARC